MASADFTIGELLAWARTKPAERRYCYNDNGHCALSQFLRETGRCADPNVGSSTWGELGQFGGHVLPSWADEAAFAGDDAERWTFGAFVGRLEAMLPAEPISGTWTRLDAYLTDIETVEA